MRREAFLSTGVAILSVRGIAARAAMFSRLRPPLVVAFTFPLLRRSGIASRIGVALQ